MRFDDVCSCLVALYRWSIVGQDCHALIGNLLALAENNPSIFSKVALGRRKLKSAANTKSWLADYLNAIRKIPGGEERIQINVAFSGSRGCPLPSPSTGLWINRTNFHALMAFFAAQIGSILCSLITGMAVGLLRNLSSARATSGASEFVLTAPPNTV